MRLAIIGHGYVGLVTAAVFSDLGNTIYCVGRTREKIEALNNGIMPFFEPGLEEVVKRNIAAGRLKFTLSYGEAIVGAEIIFICVGTPSASTGEADLTSVFTAAESISKHIKDYTVIACKSTVPVGTNKKVQELISGKTNKRNFDIASCPEFLREGTALSDTLNPDRIVIGTETIKAQKVLIKLHEPITGKRILTDIPTAEMIKYSSNALLAIKISFANAISFICDKIGADVEKVLEGVGGDRRLGRNFLYPGVGYGGSCLPKDVKALIVQAKVYGYDFNLLKAVEEINEKAITNAIDKITKLLPDNSVKVLGVLGLSFKPNTDDMRDAPSIKIINHFQGQGYKIQAYDPEAMNNAKKILKNVIYVNTPYEAAKGASALIILTEWNEFRQIDLLKIKKNLDYPLLFDGRNIYDPNVIKKLGFKYSGVGRG